MKRSSKFPSAGILGIDVGGSAVKGAPVDIRKGDYLLPAAALAGRCLIISS